MFEEKEDKKYNLFKCKQIFKKVPRAHLILLTMNLKQNQCMHMRVSLQPKSDVQVQEKQVGSWVNHVVLPCNKQNNKKRRVR